jgi:DNA invertase Pin-like site-specific DNA recombinase
MERELILERTRAGLESARLQGRVGGRKRRMTDSKVQAAGKLLANGTPPHEVAGCRSPRYIDGCRPPRGA